MASRKNIFWNIMINQTIINDKGYRHCHTFFLSEIVFQIKMKCSLRLATFICLVFSIKAPEFITRSLIPLIDKLNKCKTYTLKTDGLSSESDEATKAISKPLVVPK